MFSVASVSMMTDEEIDCAAEDVDVAGPEVDLPLALSSDSFRTGEVKSSRLETERSPNNYQQKMHLTATNTLLELALAPKNL